MYGNHPYFVDGDKLSDNQSLQLEGVDGSATVVQTLKTNNQNEGKLGNMLWMNEVWNILSVENGITKDNQDFRFNDDNDYNEYINWCKNNNVRKSYLTSVTPVKGYKFLSWYWIVCHSVIFFSISMKAY